jgi:hypothetical protein
MTKLTLSNLTDLANDVTAVGTINANNDAIETALENTLSRDGTSPNTMGANFDMNSYRIINLPAPISGSEPARLQDLATLNGGGTITSLPSGGTTGQILAKNSNTNYDVAWSSANSFSAGTNITLTGAPPTQINTTLTPTFTTVNKVTITAPSVSAVLTIANACTLTVPANATVSGTNTGDQTITLTGDVTGTGTGSFAATIAANAVTNAKMATMATNTIKANVTGGTAIPTDATLTSILDTLSTTQGSVLYRNSGAWVALSPGTAGQFLSTGGAGANPSWAGGGAGTGTVTSITAAQGISGGTVTTVGTFTLDPTYLTKSFGGRLTLVSGTPIMTTDVTAAQTLYYAPYCGRYVPINTAGTWALKTFTSSATDVTGLSLALAGSANWAADSLHDVFAVIDAGTTKIGTRAWDAGMSPTEPQITFATSISTGQGGTAWTRFSAAFDGTTVQTVANAARCAPSNAAQANYLGQDWGGGVTKVLSKVVIYGPSDDFLRGDAATVLTLTIDGSNDNINWHLISVVRVNASTTAAVYTIPLNAEEQLPCRYHRVGFEGNGVSAINVAEIQFYNKVAAASGRRLTLRDGVYVNDAAMTVRTGAATTISTAQYEGTYLGTIHIDTSTAGQISAHATYGPSRTYGVWNMYNRKKITLRGGTYNTATSYSPVTTQLWNACESAVSGTTFNTQVVVGVAEEPVRAELIRTHYMDCTAAAASYECGIGIDTTANFSGTQGLCNIDTAGQAIGFAPRAAVNVAPFAGVKILYAIERKGNSGTGTQAAFTGVRSTCLTTEWMG